MIKSADEFHLYLKSDKIANGKENTKLNIFHFAGFGEAILVFLVLLRKLEYIKNCKKGFVWSLYFKVLYYLFTKQSMKLGFSIPLNTIGKGVCLPHRGTIVVNSKAKIGDFCKIHVCTNIGGFNGGTPEIGNRVYIGPGAKIFGGIKIADDIVIGANAVVNKSFLESGITIGGIPAKKISDNDSSGLIAHGE